MQARREEGRTKAIEAMDMEVGNRNRQVVESLYCWLSRGDTAAVAAVLAEDVDWWFHGPRRCQQHMRRLLTGEATPAAFRFTPARVTELGGAGAGAQWVVAEGWGAQPQHEEEEEAEGCCYWVHAWMLRGGVITAFREYMNTAVTVRDKSSDTVGWAVWKSQPQQQPRGLKARRRRSMPGLVLAI